MRANYSVEFAEFSQNRNYTHTVWKNEKFSRTEKKKSRQTNSLVIPMLSRTFCEKNVRENFCNFHTHSVEITENLSHCFLAKKSKFFRETNAVDALFSKMA